MSATWQNRIINFSDALGQWDGATLEWRFLTVSHGQFCLTIWKDAGRRAELLFVSTEYIACSSRMQNVRLRVAAHEQTEHLRQKLPRERGSDLEREDHLVIYCDEGVFEIWARALVIREESALSREVADSLSRPLWPGGPPLADL